jgi:NAD+ kinase
MISSIMEQKDQKSPPPATSDNSRRPLKVILLGFGGREGVLEGAQHLRKFLPDWVTVMASDFNSSEDLSQIDANVAIVLGGDGSILRAAHQMGKHQLPVLAVNMGRLGFLADISLEEVPSLLDEYRQGNLRVFDHLMFECQWLRGETLIHHELGLNEVAVQNGASLAILDIELYVDGEQVTTYSCDGLIISSPVGSTAHSLSAGGPILRKSMQAFVISPISPHTLTHRPVVDSADRVFDLVVPHPVGKPGLVIDGRVIGTLEPGDRIRIEKSANSFQLIASPQHSYYRTLREKLGWSGRFKRLESR